MPDKEAKMKKQEGGCLIELQGGCLIELLEIVIFILAIAFLVTHWSEIWHWVTTVQF